MGVTDPADAADKLAAVRALVQAAQARADRAGALADRHDALAADPGNPHRALHCRMGQAHRGTQQRHAAVARLHARYLAALRRYQSGPPTVQPPRFIDALAAQLGAADLGLALLGDGQWAASTGTTPLVKAAQDLEYTLGQGPMHQAAAHGVVRAEGPHAIQHRWPRYGAALTGLGARSVQAAAVSAAGTVLGALLVLDQPTHAGMAADPLTRLAEQVALSLLLALEQTGTGDDPGGHPVLGEADDWAHIHQAAGIVAVQQRCSIRDALDLLRARAFASDVPTTRLAEQVLHHQARLD